ncbi:MAG: SUMF1/EgtB/PvdO family nonheme iron enzyme, partial [Myxococcota bacterium]
READALRFAPRERGRDGEAGALIYGRSATGGFVLQADADGDVWSPQWPVMNVDWDGARGYLAWLAARTGRGWRLAGELEWEKAARGVDGRRFPFGNHFDPSWSRIRPVWEGRVPRDIGPADVDSYPIDVSPFGVRGMAGNLMDWCLDTDGRVVDNVVLVPEAGELGPLVPRAARGGTWYGNERSQPTDRHLCEARGRFPHYGIRGLHRPLG